MAPKQKIVERVIDSDFILELYENYKKNPNPDYLEDIKKTVKLIGRTIEYDPGEG